jgi:hypothetical protein
VGRLKGGLGVGEVEELGGVGGLVGDCLERGCAKKFVEGNANRFSCVEGGLPLGPGRGGGRGGGGREAACSTC